MLFLFPLILHAQRVKQVCGEYTYYAEGNESPNQAKLKAWEGAKVEALAREFGTIVSQSTTQSETLANGNGWRMWANRSMRWSLWTICWL